MRTKNALFLTALVVVALHVSGGSGEEPLTPSAPDITAGVPRHLTASVAQSLPVVREGDSFRYEGVFVVTADSSFDPATLANHVPKIELLQYGDPGVFLHRVIVGATEDASLPGVTEWLRRQPGVLSAGKDWLRGVQALTADPYWETQLGLGLRLMNIPGAWMVTTGGSPSVRVAVFDSGVNVVPDLEGKVAQGINFFSENGTPDTETTDKDGHGTSVASIIAAEIRNGRGIAGIAPKTTIVPVKVCDPYYGLGGLVKCPDHYIDQALNWLVGEALNGRIDVINMSIGSDGGPSPAGNEYLRQIDSRGVIVVAAAGNGGDEALEWPGSSPNVVTVAGALADGQRAIDSDYGPDVEVAAPMSTYAYDENGYVRPFVGTSAAAPVIAGVAALYKASALVELSSRAAFEFDMRWFWDPAGNIMRQRLDDEQIGIGVPDAFTTIWMDACTRLDVVPDYVIDVADAQYIARLFGTFFGDLFYNSVQDIEPNLRSDGDIDIKDLQKIFGRDSMHCRRP